MTTTRISNGTSGLGPSALSKDEAKLLPTDDRRLGGSALASRSASSADTPAPAPAALHLLQNGSVPSFLAAVESRMLANVPLQFDLRQADPKYLDALIRSLPSFALTCVAPLVFKSGNETNALARSVFARLRFPYGFLGTGLTDKSLKDLSPELSDSSAEEVSLPLRQSGDEEGESAGFRRFLRALQKSEVTSLSAAWGVVDAETLDELGNTILGAPRLSNLDLRSNQIQPDEVAPLGAAAARRPPEYPLSLGLRFNPIGDEGLEYLCQSGALSDGTYASGAGGYIDRLDVSGCGITDRGFLALAQVLPEAALVELFMRESLISSERLRLFVDAVRRSRLRRLDLRGTPFTAADEALFEDLLGARPDVKLPHHPRAPRKA